MIAPVIWSWIWVAAWAGVIFTLSNIPHLNSGLGLWDFPLRKLAHMGEFAVLFFLFCRAAHRTWTNWSLKRIVGAGMVFCLFYALTDEFHQTFIAGRVGSITDVIIDLTGVALAAVAYRRWKINYDR